jgi:4-amino-4-deoxy-L-arabinose transferase-like glycosyltransferase
MEIACKVTLGIASVVYVACSLLSVFGRLHVSETRVAFGLLAALLVAAMCWRVQSYSGRCPAILITKTPAITSLRDVPRRPASLMAVVLGCTFVLAMIAPPNNFDSMTYHLPRVMRWLHDGSVAPFATSNERQVYQSPGAEYLQLAAFAITSRYEAMNLVSWSCLVLCATTAALLAGRLGGDQLEQWLAACLAVTLPMAIFQSTNTKNDILVAWFFCMALLAVLEMRTQGISLRLATMLGVSVGWMLLTKGTAYTLAPAVAAWSVYAALNSKMGPRGLGKLGFAAAIAACFIMPHWLMNNDVFGSPLGPEAQAYYPKGNRLAATAANVFRNLGSESITPLPAVNGLIVSALERITAAFCVDIHDPSSIGWSGRFFLYDKASLSEDHAGAPLHLVLFMCAAIAVALNGTRLAHEYLVVIATAFLVFCATVSWQQWICRLLLPLAVAAAPVTAVGLRFGAWPTWARNWSLVGLLVATSPFLMFNTARYLVGPASVLTLPTIDAQFLTDPLGEAPFVRLVDQLKQRNARHVGLLFDGNEWEFPLWRALGGPDRVFFEHIGVTNATARLRPANATTPPLVITAADKYREPRAEWHDALYRKAWESERHVLYELDQHK